MWRNGDILNLMEERFREDRRGNGVESLDELLQVPASEIAHFLGTPGEDAPDVDRTALLMRAVDRELESESERTPFGITDAVRMVARVDANVVEMMKFFFGKGDPRVPQHFGHLRPDSPREQEAAQSAGAVAKAAAAPKNPGGARRGQLSGAPGNSELAREVEVLRQRAEFLADEARKAGERQEERMLRMEASLKNMDRKMERFFEMAEGLLLRAPIQEQLV